MRKVKLVMITAFMSFALVSFANAELGMSQNVISLKSAQNNVEMVHAIQDQVNPAAVFNSDRGGSYTAQVVLKKTVYLITGTISEWKLFFRYLSGKSPLCGDTTDPGSINDGNNFGVNKVKVNWKRQENPFGHAGTKHATEKSLPGMKSDR